MTCPLCHKKSENDFTPFCSNYCRNRDLLKWLQEDYLIPATTITNEEFLQVQDLTKDEFE